MLAMDYVLFFTEVFHYNNVSSSIKKNAFLKMKMGVFYNWFFKALSAVDKEIW